MSDIAVKIEQLGKKYVIRHQRERKRYETLRDVLADKAKSFFKNREPETGDRKSMEEFWALQDVSFEVKKGDVVGVIGRNGAGKSTLLKLLSRVTEPTTGCIKLNGRVASLLEVGTGFHPELTGRENIFLNGAILGMHRAEIKQKFDEIVAFAEMEKFLDTPVKRYSSGMYMRLAFAVAAHLEPEILVVDEVLAVGDMQFQNKCMGKMQEVSRGGRTVLFVSHNMGAISSLCQKVVFLEKGRLAMMGDTAAVIHTYNFGGGDTTAWTGSAGNQQLKLKGTWVRSLDPAGRLHTAAEIEIGIELEILQRTNNLIMGFHLYSEYGTPLAYCLYDDRRDDPPPTLSLGKMVQKFVIPANTLALGTYHVHFNVGIHNIQRIIDQDGMLTFSLENVCGMGRRFHTSNARGFASLFRPDWARGG